MSSGHNASETTRSQCIGLFGYSFFTDDYAAAVLTTGTKWGGLLTGRKQEHVKFEDQNKMNLPSYLLLGLSDPPTSPDSKTAVFSFLKRQLAGRLWHARAHVRGLGGWIEWVDFGSRTMQLVGTLPRCSHLLS